MSIYSGFANRQLESNYNRLVEGTLRILQSRILKFYEEFAEDDKNFIKLLSKNVSYLAIMERNKYLPPKLSECLRDICTFLQIEIPSNEQLPVTGNMHSIQQHEGLQRNNSFTRKSMNNSPSQQSNYQRTFSPIHNDYSTLKRSNSPGQQRTYSPKGNNINYQNSKRSLSPVPQNNNQINQRKNQNGNLRTISPRGINQNKTSTQNSQSKLNRDNSNRRIQPFQSEAQQSNQNSQQYTKMNPNYLYNYNIKKQPSFGSKQQINSNRSQSPKGGYVQGYSNVNTSYRSGNSSRINSPRYSTNNVQTTNQQKNVYNTNQKNNTISEGNSQFYDYHINEKRNQSVQSRNFRMKTLNNSPSNKDYQNDNQLTRRHNSSQIQKDLASQFGLNKKNGINMQKRNSLNGSKIVKNQERIGSEIVQQTYNYNPKIYTNNNSNQSYLTKQKIRQNLENSNDYTLVDETISQMKKQINIYCKQNKPEQNPFEISPPQNNNSVQQAGYDKSSKIVMQQLLQQSKLMNDNDDIVIETKSYTITKNQTQ